MNKNKLILSFIILLLLLFIGTTTVSATNNSSTDEPTYLNTHHTTNKLTFKESIDNNQEIIENNDIIKDSNKLKINNEIKENHPINKNIKENTQYTDSHLNNKQIIKDSNNSLIVKTKNSSNDSNILKTVIFNSVKQNISNNHHDSFENNKTEYNVTNYSELSKLMKSVDNGSYNINLNYGYYNITSLILLNNNKNMVNITINGNNQVINGNNNSFINIGPNYIVNINNIQIQNTYNKYKGSAIFSRGIINLNNCTFINCTSYDGGAIYINSTENNQNNIVNSLFYNNKALVSAGSIKIESNTNIINCSFINSKSEVIGGAISLFNCNSNMIMCNFINNTSNDGGAIKLSNSLLNITNSVFIDNKAVTGGAIYNYQSKLFLNNSLLNNNNAKYRGGAITVIGELEVLNSILNHNHATYGGAIHLFKSKGSIENSIFENNTVIIKGGAINNDEGNITINNDTFTLNEAMLYGGALNNYAYSNLLICNSTLNNNSISFNTFDDMGDPNIHYEKEIFEKTGGAISNHDSNVTILNSILNNNKSPNAGGAIFNYYGLIQMNNTVITNSTSIYGAALCNNHFCTIILYNNTFMNNNGINGSVIYNNVSSNVLSYNNTFENNNEPVLYDTSLKVSFITSLKVSAIINPIKGGDKVTISALIKDENGSYINSGYVIFKIDGITIKNSHGNIIEVPVINGIAKLSNYQLDYVTSQTNYTITAIYKDNFIYKPSKKNISVNIEKSNLINVVTLPNGLTALIGILTNEKGHLFINNIKTTNNDSISKSLNLLDNNAITFRDKSSIYDKVIMVSTT